MSAERTTGGAVGLSEIGALYQSIERRTRARVSGDYDAGEQNAYGNVLMEIEERFAHFHASGALTPHICARCGLHLYNDIHKRETAA